MQCLRWEKIIFSSIISVLGLAAVALPVIAEDSDQSMRKLTEATETLGQNLQERIAAQLQQTMVEEIVLQYEMQLAQQAAEHMDQLTLAVNIDSEPVISIDSSEMLAAVVIPAKIEVDCNN